MSNEELFINLVAGSAADARAWLQKVINDEIEFPYEFNWQGFAEVAAANARLELNGREQKRGLIWAEVAITIYERLASDVDAEARNQFENSAMLTRAVMIKQFGSVDADYVLDIYHIMHWFYDNLTMSPREALNISNQWHSLPRAEQLQFDANILLAIRHIKNRLQIIKLLYESNYLSNDEEIKDWMTIREQLV